MPIRIVLADDHVLVRQGLRSLLEREGLIVTGEAADGREAVQQAQALRPDVAIMDGAPCLHLCCHTSTSVLWPAKFSYKKLWRGRSVPR